MPLPVANYARTVCPLCGGIAHKCISVVQRGSVVVRYHWCPCSHGPETVATFITHQSVRRVCRVPRDP